MDSAVRRYITRTLLIHFGFLVMVAVVVGLAARALYVTAEQQAENAAVERLRQPANTAADGIRRHFGGVLDTIDVGGSTARRAGLPAAGRALGGALWDQLSGRTSDLLVVRVPDDGGDLRVIEHFRNDPSNPLDEVVDGVREVPDSLVSVLSQADADQFVRANADWIRGIVANGPSLSEAMASESGGLQRPVIAAAATFGGDGGPPARNAADDAPTPRPAGRQVIVTLVPTSYLDESFLLSARLPGTLALLLLDGNATLISGLNVAESGTAATRTADSGDDAPRDDITRAGPSLADLARDGVLPREIATFLTARASGRTVPTGRSTEQTRVNNEPFDGILAFASPVRTAFRGEAAPPAEAVDLADPAEAADPAARADAGPATPEPNRLWVGALLNRGAVVAPLRDTTGTATLWAFGVVVAVSLILVSSSVQLIRGRSRLERLRSEMVDKEMRDARKIQMSWLPAGEAKWLANCPVSVAAENVPASHISGDFYNYFSLPDENGDECGRVALVIGDVTGHGMAAAFLMATTQLLIRTSLMRTRDPGKTLTEVNNLLSEQVTGGQFVTLFLGVLDPEGDAMAAANAGHFGPLACDEDGIWHEIDVEGELVLGVMSGTNYPTRHVDLQHARAFMFYTDGAVEAEDASGDRFDARRLGEGLQTEMPGGPQSAKEIVAGALRVVRGFAGGVPFADDVTLLSVHLEPEDSPAEKAKPAQSAKAGRPATVSA